jgi:hypothetical protein
VQCDVGLASWAVIYGAMSICFGGVNITTGVVSLFSWLGSVVTVSISLLIATANVGLLIWGSVLAFSNNRWTSVMVSPPASGAPCAVDLYRTVSVIIIVSWVFIGTLSPFKLALWFWSTFLAVAASSAEAVAAAASKLRD